MIHFRLGWVRGALGRKHYENPPCYELFSDYLQRISHFVACDASGVDLGRRPVSLEKKSAIPLFALDIGWVLSDLYGMSILC
jgi:hypothetical protein